jgi:hypothetical protein
VSEGGREGERSAGHVHENVPPKSYHCLLEYPPKQVAAENIAHHAQLLNESSLRETRSH